MRRFSVPPGYRRSQPPWRPKLDPFVELIDRILEEDRSSPRKQWHTAKRIFERLLDEHGFSGGYAASSGMAMPGACERTAAPGGVLWLCAPRSPRPRAGGVSGP